jgi:prolipoprotein diacylglyceryltransferase
MPPLFTSLGPFTFRTFTLALALGFFACLALVLFAAPRKGLSVLLNWDYYIDNLNEAARLSSGGLSWHGAVLGGLLGLFIAAKLRKLPIAELLDMLTPAPALLMLSGWYACWSANGACGYGIEVDTLARYPAYAVSEAPDIYGIVAPRYNTQAFGVALAMVLLVLAALLLWRSWLRYRRFWLLLTLASAATFMIGFWRGDPSPIINGLRLDQWLDAIVAAIAIGSFCIPRTKISYEPLAQPF